MKNQDGQQENAGEIKSTGMPEHPTLECCFHIRLVANPLLQHSPAFPEQKLTDMRALAFKSR